MMMSFISLGFVGVLWAVVGYSLAFAPGNDWIGDLSRVLPARRRPRSSRTIPHLLFMCYQGTFCIITAALISGAIVERMRFSAYVAFITLWALVVYTPIAHWVWGGGFLSKMGALDFAGGTVVHVNAGVAALVAALARRPPPRLSVQRRSSRTTCRSRSSAQGSSGSGGSDSTPAARVAANRIAALAFTTTMLAPAGTLVVWTILDAIRSQRVHGRRRGHRHRRRSGRDHARGRFRRPDERDHVWARLPRFRATSVCCGARRTNLDDSLDVVAAHGLGGTVGALLTGVFAQKSFNGVADGLLFGNPAQLGIQAIAVGVRDCLQRRHELCAAETRSVSSSRFARH